MRFWVGIAILALALAGCDARDKPGDAVTTPPEDPAIPDPSDTTSEPEAEFFFYDDTSPGGAAQPTFVMRVPRFSIDDKGVAVVEDAKAEILGKDGEISRLWAEHGRFDGSARTVLMEGRVIMEISGMRIEASGIEWTEDEGTARSEQPVRIVDGATDLAASELTFVRDTDTITLRDVTGTIQLDMDKESMP